jgi:hypothetical protein
MSRLAVRGLLLIVLALALLIVTASGLVGAVAAHTVFDGGTGIAVLSFVLMLITLNHGLERLGRGLVQK